MAVTNQSFNTAVTAWVAKSEARMLAVLKEFCQRLVNEATEPDGRRGQHAR